MRRAVAALVGSFFVISGNLFAQNCIPTGIQGSTVDLLCNEVCTILTFQVPHLKSSDEYTIVQVPYTPYPYNTPTGIEDNNLYDDDKYSFLINLPFNFCFYGSPYSTAVVGSNGLMTFDAGNANCNNAYPINTTIPYNGGTICGPISPAYYPRASIMGAYSDLDPSGSASPGDVKIQWEVVGTAPCRKFVVSYYRVGSFGVSCGFTSPNTYQMVIHESTGIVEIFTESFTCHSSTNNGRGIQGLQNWDRDKAVWVPGRNNTVWSDNNSGYQFVPSGGTSRYLIAEILDMNENVVAVADTLTTTAGLLDLQFPNFCPPTGTTQYAVRTQFTDCANPANVISIDTFTVNRTNDLGATASATPTACGPPSGSITVMVPTGVGTPPYTYILDAGAPVVAPSPYTFAGLAAGTYNISVTDASAGCISTIDIDVIQNNNLTATTIPTATSCPGVNNGSIVVNPTNGTAPYTFTLNPGAIVQNGATADFQNLPPGAYTVTIADASSCISSPPLNVNVATGPGLAANLVQSATSCAGAADGSITITPTSGTAPYTYSLDGAPAVAGSQPFTFSNLSPGLHTIILFDDAGCASAPMNITVQTGPVLTTAVSKTDVLCNGDASGIIMVTEPAMGTGPYEYSLDGISWQTANQFTGLAAGIYTVHYRSGNGCSGSQQITITQPTVLAATASAIPVICYGESNGTLTVIPSGGVSPYQYSINGGATWQPNNIFSLPANTYEITIRDANGCITTQTVEVTQPPVLTAFSNTTNATCDGGNDGIITITAGGGNGNYQYALDGGNFQSSNIFNAAPGDYTVTVRDALGCISTFTTNVGLNNNLSFTLPPDPVICEGSSTQLEIVSNATGYTWSPSTGLSNAAIANPVANPVVTTPYTVTITLGRCAATETVTVSVNAAPVPDAGPDGFICYGQTYQMQGSGGTQYLWTPNTFLGDPANPATVSSATSDITYTLRILSDVNGCPSLVTDEMTLDVTPPFKVNTFPFDTVAYSGNQFMLQAVPTDPDVIHYSWVPAFGLSDAGIANPVVTAGAVGDVVQYEVTASTVGGCIGIGYVTVKVYKGPDIYVPTAFTPNGDGRNDRFMPIPVGIKSLNYFRVFNRWGQLLYSTNTLHQGWDGRVKGTEQATGVYVWMIEVVTNEDKVVTKKGVVTLIR